jgi:tryptophan synthase alpha chain
MSYYNPVRQRGEEQFAADLVEAQADGAILVDLPPEEATSLRAALDKHDLALIPLVAPTTPAARLRTVLARPPAFVYCITLVGVTGARQDLSDGIGSLLERVRQETPAPLVVGFGISQPRHVERVADLGAAGAIVGGALADLIERSDDPVSAARTYLQDLKGATLSRGHPAPASP